MILAGFGFTLPQYQHVTDRQTNG